MKADIITIGDEILIGQVIDTNSSFLASKLNLLGFEVRKVQSISDSAMAITKALDEAIFNSELLIITGGLGPTNDDITKKTLQEYFGGDFHYDENALDYIKSLHERRGIPMNERNRWQAAVPDTCQVLRNQSGSAPGMVFRKDDSVIVSLPGVPYEMKDIFNNELIPLLREEFDLPFRIHRTVLTTGIPESVAADMLHDWELEMGSDMRLAYLPSPGRLRLRISLSGNNKDYLNNKLNQEVEKVISILGEKHVFGFDEDTLEEVVGKMLIKHEKTLSLAESCTGGYLAHRITSVAGSSAYFSGSVTSYSNAIKQNVLGVSEEALRDYGAVSKQVVEQMAVGVNRLMGTDFSIATSGIAGPGGGTSDKPVGTTWIAVAYKEKVWAMKFLFGNHRQRNIEMTSATALNTLRNVLIKHVENIGVKS